MLGPVDGKRALALLNAVGRDPSPTAVRAFDEFFYPIVLRYVLKRHRFIGLEIARRTGAGGVSAAPMLADHQVEEAAHTTALIALRRARASARRFDPEAGDPVAWVVGAAAFAYVEVAKAMRREREDLAPGADVAPERATPSEDQPADILERQDLLDDLFLVLGDEERAVVILVLRYSYSYAEAAEVLLGDPAATKRIDYLLQSARRKLAPRWAALHDTDGR
jgi:DNA-directed RNA polymerase specialized sigma24 family protein